MTAGTASLESLEMIIGGRRTGSASGETYESVNPSTGEAWGRFPEATAEDVDRAVRAARQAFEESVWATMTGFERGKLMRRLADLVADHVDELAALDTRETGRIITDTTAVSRVLADYLMYYAGWADKLDGRLVALEKRDLLNYTIREPLGVVGVMFPWNNPVVTLGFKMAAAIATGNTFVIKPSEYASASTLRFAELAEEAGFPAGVFNVVTGGARAGQALSSHPDIDKITFTGGPVNARNVARAAAENLTPATFELGGKSANIVFDDADFDSAVNGAMTIFSGVGQSCVAPSRLLVQRGIYEDFMTELHSRVARIRIGDPFDSSTQMGPVGTRPQFEKNLAFCTRGVDDGATVAYGGERTTVTGFESGFFFTPTIFRDVDPASYISQEEAFGPIVSATPFDTEDDAIRIANGTRYALAAGVWTQNLRRAHQSAHRLRAGMVWVNTYRNISFASPFGGNKESGHGRENGPEALEEFSAPKSVWVELSGQVADPFNWKS